jgi:hypothetical protein
MRRHRAVVSALILIAATMSSSACDEELADLNENPNAPTDVPAEFLLPTAILGTAEIGTAQSGSGALAGTWFTLEFTGLFGQHWAKIQYTTEDQYLLRENVINSFWNNFYSAPLNDWNTIVEKGVETSLVNHQAVGMVGRAYTIQMMTDIWGDIPYSQALQGNAEDPITAPEYDTQEAIYMSILEDLETASGMLDPASRSFGQADLLYGGDVTQWERFANSLRLRAAMRISDTAPEVVRPIVEALAGAPLIFDNADNARIMYVEGPPSQNPLYENAAVGGGTRDDHATSNTLINLLGQLNDPRIRVYAEPAAVPDPSADFPWCGAAGEPACHVESGGQVYRGMRNGVNAGDVPEPLGLWSRIGNRFRTEPATPQELMTAAEVRFLLAEAALKGWSVGASAQAHYEAGVRASFEQWSGPEADLGPAAQEAYLAQPGVAWGTGDSNEELIGEQKWLALYNIPWEAYAEYRRTGFPDEVMPAIDASISYVPGRIPYPDVEQSLNSANLSAAVQRQPTDGTYKGSVWWDPVPPP